MSTVLENQPFWPKIVADLKKRKLRDLAKEYKVPVADLQKALERTGLLPGSTNSKVAEPVKPAAPVPAKAEKAKKAQAKAEKPAKTEAKVEAAPADAGPRRGGAAAKLEGVRAQLGKVADGVLAEQLGIARKTVVEFRKRNGISAYSPRLEEKPAAAAPKAAAAPAPQAAPRKPGRPPKAAKAAEAAPVVVAVAAPPPAKEAAPAAARPSVDSITGRASKLDPFRDIIGKLPDREVAERAGMTTENVRMFRQRRGIPAGWREEGKVATPAKAAAPAKASVPAKAEVAAKAAKAAKAEKAAKPVAKVEAPAPVAKVEAPKETKAEARKRGRQPAAPGETKVELALAPFRDAVGVLPDAEVAAKAGVSRSAVSAFRQKFKIKASGKGGRPPKNRGDEVAAAKAAPPAKAEKAAPKPEVKVEAKPAAKATEAAKPAEATVAQAKPAETKAAAKAAEAAKPAEAPKAAAKPARAEAVALDPQPLPPRTGGFVYRVTAIRDGEKRTFGLIAADPVEAAQRAQDHFAKKGKWVLRDIRLIAEALPG